MVNARVIAAASVLSVGTISGIVVWMKTRGHTTSNMTLKDACDGYFGENGKVPEVSTNSSLSSCDFIKSNGWEWDTAIPCRPDGDSFYTMRGLFDAMDSDMSNFAWPDRGALDMMNYIKDSCHGPNRKLISDIDPELGRELGTWWSDVNYNSCSVNLALSFIGGNWATDNAECSGNPLSHGNCGGLVAGKNGATSASIRRMFPTGDGWWLTKGCYNHDVCLQKSGNGNANTPYGTGKCGSNVPWYGTSSYFAESRSYGCCGFMCTGTCPPTAMVSNGQQCDDHLANSAYQCTLHFIDCKDSTIYSAAVYAAIGGFRPNYDACK
jgi:hypothetical protein